ncbi:L-fuculokinase [Dysgonomonas sp. Marseille-P4361]|uniref:FGGY-family carbohydrate kinase n=1 Tax=Dysgonomonas sp. Marseille-P4361 TaxID=2161820 RepID=UPI000D54BDF0|nr:FGGY family carbohydrate kinase [Dysgonomonas sp. Marseille-P4361]
MSFFLGIDLGTTYFKAGIFDETGKLFGLGRYPVKKNTAGGNICELDVEVFWKTLNLSIRKAIKEADISPKQIRALSYSSQANSFILLDEFDNPLTSLILWSDERVVGESVRLKEFLLGEDFLYKTGLGISPGRHSLIAKVNWFQSQQPHVWKKVRHIMSISDYLVFILTGNRISDMSTSSMTGLLNVQEGQWWRDALDTFHIDEKQLSTLFNVGIQMGNLSERGTRLIGLSAGALIFSGGLDHHMVAIGAGIPYSGNISESTGTVLACVNCQNEYKPRAGVNIARGLDDSHYFQMAFASNGATALDWYRSNYAPELSVPALLAMAEKVPPGCEGVVAKPSANEYEGLKGFTGINGDHMHAHFVRAILESTSLSLGELINYLDRSHTRAIIPSGGGARSRLWLQIKADMLNRTFLLPESGELACKGAAMLCMVGMSCFKA